MFKMKILIALSAGLSVLLSFPESASAAKQNYERRYQKKTKRVQKKNPHLLNLNVPNSFSYFNVSRKMPKVTVDYQPQKTIYRQNEPEITCYGKKTLSCTHYSVAFSADTDCETSRIVLTVTEPQPMTAELSSAYPKGNCFFDQILKHELSHIETYKTVLESFIRQASEEIEKVYASGQRGLKKCEDIQNEIKSLTDSFAQRYAEEAQEENDKKDAGKGPHPYDFGICQPQAEE